MTTPIFVTGFEYGLAALTINGGGLFNYVYATVPPTIVNTEHHSGAYALKVAASAQLSYVRWNLATPTTFVSREYFKIETAPSAAAFIAFITPTAATGTPPRIYLNPTNGKVELRAGANVVAVGDSYPTDGSWFYVDWYVDVSANPWRFKGKVNGGTEFSGNYASAADTLATHGVGTSATATYTIYVDDVVVSVTGADYPIGPGGTELLIPSTDGTHNNGANILENAAGADINGSSVFAYQQVQGVPMGDATTRVQQNGASGTSYVAVNFANISAAHASIIGAMAVLAYQSASATANTAGCIVTKDNFSTATTVWGAPGAEADYSESSVFWKSVIIAGAVDDTTVNALAARMGYSSDATPDPWWVDLAVEVAYATSTVPQLAPANCAQAQAADNVVLTAYIPTFTLTILDAGQGQSADSLTLTAHPPSTPLTIQDAAQLQAAGAPALTQHNTLAVSAATQAQSVDGPALTQHNVLSIAGAAQPQSADGVTLTAHVPGAALTIASCAQAQTAENTALTQHHVLAIASAAQLQAADNAELIPHAPGGVVLTIADATQLQGVDALTLVQHAALTIADATQLQSVDAPVLVYHEDAGLALVIANAVQLQEAGAVVLTLRDHGEYVVGIESRVRSVPAGSRANAALAETRETEVPYEQRHIH